MDLALQCNMCLHKIVSYLLIFSIFSGAIASDLYSLDHDSPPEVQLSVLSPKDIRGSSYGFTPNTSGETALESPSSLSLSTPATPSKIELLPPASKTQLTDTRSYQPSPPRHKTKASRASSQVAPSFFNNGRY